MYFSSGAAWLFASGLPCFFFFASWCAAFSLAERKRLVMAVPMTLWSPPPALLFVLLLTLSPWSLPARSLTAHSRLWSGDVLLLSPLDLPDLPFLLGRRCWGSELSVK